MKKLKVNEFIEKKIMKEIYIYIIMKAKRIEIY